MPLWLRVLIGAIAFFLILALFGLLLRWASVAIFVVALIGAIIAAFGFGQPLEKAAEKQLKRMERQQQKEQQQVLRRK
jgi:uncharacterized membrane protein YuzA (DUF378 family)